MSKKLDLADLAMLRGIGEAMTANGYSPDGALVIDAAAALAAEWARPDQAEKRIADALAKLDQIDVYHYEFGSASVGDVKRILSAAPTTEPSDQ